MNIIYIDKDFKCHIENDGSMISIEDPFFHNKCQKFIEGYRYVPKGKSWTREDGVTFIGKMISPWKPYEELEIAQREYE
jgi:hypothetical protein